ncbi:hypothetical protein Patl_1081 [Paraglaciecola sp. T6c]|uniref:right-handed parallel beta-helix repeat-containing protein n=1 Tax=Pseudoalteromonas atlantica (strain T6c / ATCC BAA-1087) TaxID=3042615 RepID=UPI00005C6F3C|nr:right-handed parallel beta-helix repeat-containing protein [Paraglaciecola sp. T6c]ABG39607.1 hypothetical protein Patl_1081 [Paraglaciecola sp. T6c]
MVKLNKIMGFGAHLLMATILLGLASCAQFDAPKHYAVNGQLGDYLVNQINQQKITSRSEIVSMLKDPSISSKKSNRFLIQNEQDTAILLKEITTSQDVTQAVIRLIESDSKMASKWVTLALRLYPIDAYRMLEQLYADSTIQSTLLESAALKAGLDPARLFPATTSSDLDHRIVPLIHSASITIYNQSEDTDTRLWFKPSGATQWTPALALEWEPIQGALSGSIVRLEPQTVYEVKLEYVENGQIIDQQQYSFQTRPNSPPIDPDKIYYLSDIYTGGQLDLTTLGIQGSEEGWALIIGDGTEIVAAEGDNAAIDIGGQSYIKFENITVKGGRLYGIGAKQAHHLWIDGCDISEFGRAAGDMRDGVAYENVESTKAINYDSGIFLQETGVVTIENCEIHSPKGKANHWQYGHPYGPSALLLAARHSVEEYRGQYIIRNNRFYGTDAKRFNDVIESRANARSWGGFLRDSAIHNNYLAYANDDLIELDGGQSNVLFYDNELEQGYCGISAIPNMLGPSYIFNNYIHNLGDERQKAWAAIKLGGLMSAPAGVVNIFENLIVTSSNGITASRFESDYTFWVNARNNVLIHDKYWTKMGQGIYDVEQYASSEFINNLIYNSSYQAPAVQANMGSDFYHPWSYQLSQIENINSTGASFDLEVDERFIISNFSSTSPASQSILAQTNSGVGESNAAINFNDTAIKSFDTQDEAGDYIINDTGATLTLLGNTWKSVQGEYEITPQTTLTFELKNNGAGEIVGIAFENDNQLTSSRLYKFSGTQQWSNNAYKYTNVGDFQTITLPIGQMSTGEIDRLVFVLDDDNPTGTLAEVSFKNVKFIEPTATQQNIVNSITQVGISNK